MRAGGLDGAAVADRLRDRPRFEQQPHLVRLTDVVGAHVAYHRAAVGADGDQTVRGERDERLADRRLGHPEQVGQAPLDQGLTRGEPAREDGFPDRVHDEI